MKNRTEKQISYNMSRIKSKDTSIEISFGKALRALGIAYKKNYKDVVGKPDLLILKDKIAIFCDSAFWHGYRNMKTIRHNFKKRKVFWVNKISQNIKRDKQVNRLLKKEGWKVVRFWDFQIEKDLDRCIKRITKVIKGE